MKTFSDRGTVLAVDRDPYGGPYGRRCDVESLSVSVTMTFELGLFLCLVLILEARCFDYDLIVYGSTPAGIAAAVAAAELNISVGLYEPLPMIGGMGAAGNLALHDGGAGTGLSLKFAELNAEWYNVSTPVAQPESFVANASFHKMLSLAGVKKVSLDCRLSCRLSSWPVENTRI